MIWGYPHFRKPPYQNCHFLDLPSMEASTHFMFLVQGASAQTTSKSTSFSILQLTHAAPPRQFFPNIPQHSPTTSQTYLTSSPKKATRTACPSLTPLRKKNILKTQCGCFPPTKIAIQPNTSHSSQKTHALTKNSKDFSRFSLPVLVDGHPQQSTAFQRGLRLLRRARRLHGLLRQLRQRRLRRWPKPW